MRKFLIFHSRHLSSSSVLVANTDFSCSGNCFNLPWSVFAGLFKRRRIWILFLLSAFWWFSMSFLNILWYEIQGRFIKRVPSFYVSCITFIFLLYEELDVEWNAGVWFGSSFWKMVVNVHNGVCEDVGYVFNDVDRPGFSTLEFDVEEYLTGLKEKSW